MKKQKTFQKLILNKVFHCFLLSMSFIFCAQLISAQEQKILVRGVVTDASGESIIGANVIQKGTTNGTITDIDGNFTLSVPSQSVLEVTYTGYIPQNVNVNGKTLLNIQMHEDAKMLDEVVVVGFGVQKKVNLTGSVGTATAKDLESRPVQNAVAALQGVVPGLNISTSGTGMLDSEKSINVRGTTTIGDGSSGSPLVLIDGMEDNLNRINPQDIESISVLKDAAASSIYGSRAPFGVILVTTKSGKEGKTVINYNNNFSYSKPINMPDLMDSWHWLNYFNDGQMNSNGSQFGYFTNKDLDGNYFSDLVKDYYDGKLDAMDTQRPKADGKWNHDYSFGNVDWLKQYYKKWTNSMEHNVSISGGSQKLSYYVSANYLDQGGLLRVGDDNYHRYSATGKINSVLNKYVSLNYTSRFSRVKYDRPTQFTSGFYDNVIRRARPVRPITDPNGNPQNDINYLDALENGGRTWDERDVFVNQFKLTITPLKDWNIIADMNIRFNNDWTHSDSQIFYTYRQDGTTKDRAALSESKSWVKEYAYKSLYINPNVYSNYSFNINEKNNFFITAGFQAEKFDMKQFSAKRNNMISDDFPVLDLTNGADLTDIGINGYIGNWRTVGFFGRVNYNFDDKYLFEFNGRYDGTSRFRRGNRWVFSPSFSVGWNMARESWFENIQNIVTTLKPRFSYGQLANQNTTSWYPTYVTMNVGTGGSSSWLINGSYPVIASAPGLVSASLTWEKIKTTNIGFDWGFMNNRLTGSFDYFIRKSLDMVGAGVTLPATLGVGVPKTNNLDLKAYGWELQVSWKDRIKDFNYGITLNIADSQTKVTKYPNPTNRLDQYRVGEVTGNIYGYTTIGIAKSQEEMDAHLAKVDQSALGSNWGAGDIMYADLDGDGKVNNGKNLLDDKGDLKVIGNTTPRYRTGITLSFDWKGIDFQMFWQGILKRDWYFDKDALLFWGISERGQWWSTGFEQHLDYFRGEEDHPLGQNLDSYYARPVLGSSKNQKTQTRYLQDASYMRLKNLQVGYTFPQTWTSKAGISKLRIYVSGENIWTITKLKDVMDPESVGIGQQHGTTYPNSASYSFGLSVTF